MLFRRDIAQHRAAVPADHGGTDTGGNVVVARSNVGRQRPERIKRGFVTDGQLLFHIGLNHVHGDMAWAFDHDLHIVLPGDVGELAQGIKLSKLSLIVGIRDRSGPEPVAEAEGHVVGLHDLTNLFEVGVGEVFLMVCQTPLCMDRPAARDNAGHACGGHRHIGQTHTGVNGKVIDALLRLFDQRVTENFPGEIFGFAVHFFERLIDRHGSDRDRRIPNNPFARLMNVFACREIHHGIGAPASRPDHLLDFFFDGGGDGRIANVGIDFHQEVSADDHRLAFRVVDVRGNDRPPACDLIAHELWCDHPGNAGAPGKSRVLHHTAAMTIVCAWFGGRFTRLVLTDGDELHLRGDDTFSCIVELCHVSTGLRPQRFTNMLKAKLG